MHLLKPSRGVARLTLAAAALLALACSDDKIWNGDFSPRGRDVVVQERAQLTLPEEGDLGYPLALTAAPEQKVSYVGNLLFWNPEVSPSQIAAIAQASSQSRLRRGQYLDHKLGVLAAAHMALAAKEAESSAHTKAMEADFANADPQRIRQAAEGRVRGWFKARLDTLGKGQAELEELMEQTDLASEAEQQFGRYCEYRLFDFAVHPLLELHFAQRPTPAMVCEPYYEKQGYFLADDGSLPSDCDPSSNGQDFFACIWRHGVLKSRLLSSLGKLEDARCVADSGLEPAANRQAAVREWLYGTHSDEHGSIAKIKLLRKALFDKTRHNRTEVKARMWNSIGKGMSFALSHPGADPRYKAVFHTCKNAFSKDVLPPAERPESGIVWTNAHNIADYKIVVENFGLASGVNTPSTFLLPTAAGGSGAFAPFYAHIDAHLVLPLARYLDRENATTVITLEKLASTTSAALPASIRVSLDDVWFNRPLEQVEMPAGDRAALEELVDLKSDYIKPEDREKAAALLHEILGLKADLEQKGAVRAHLESTVSKTVLASAEAATAPLATSFVRNFALDLANKGGILHLGFAMDDGAKHEACFDFVQLVACPAGFRESEAGRSMRAVAYDPVTKRLTFDIQLDDPVAQGFAHRPRQEPGKTDFNDLPTEIYAGRQLRFEVYVNGLGEYFRFVTGKAFLHNDDGEELLEGSLTADNYLL